MVVVLHPSGFNWFHEAIARDARDDLVAAGVDARRVDGHAFMAAGPGTYGPGQTVLVVNFRETALSLVSPTYVGETPETYALLADRLYAFDRRVLINLDSIYTDWFRMQLRFAEGSLTDLFDVGMTPQTDAGELGGLPYTWVPECPTRRQLGELPAYDRAARPFPWAIIGHAVPDRVAVADELGDLMGAGGFMFMPGVRPILSDGRRNMTADGIDRVLLRSRYYVWSSHHAYPYHENLRVLHALRNGAVPVKIEPRFGWAFADLPWVYPSVAAFARAADGDGPRALFDRAVDFVRSRGTMGDALVEALAAPRRLPAAASFVSPVRETA